MALESARDRYSLISGPGSPRIGDHPRIDGVGQVDEWRDDPAVSFRQSTATASTIPPGRCEPCPGVPSARRRLCLDRRRRLFPVDGRGQRPGGAEWEAFRRPSAAAPLTDHIERQRESGHTDSDGEPHDPHADVRHREVCGGPVFRQWFVLGRRVRGRLRYRGRSIERARHQLVFRGGRRVD